MEGAIGFRGSPTVLRYRVEMIGFTAVHARPHRCRRSAAAAIELTLAPFEEIRKIATISKPVVAAEVVAEAERPEAETAIDPELERQAAEGLLVNGSVNNAAASPFAQARAFGNARPGQRSLYNGGFGLTLGAAALDARPFSFGAAEAPKPDYTDMHFTGSVGGPFRIPGVRNRPVFFAGYQHSSDHSAIAQLRHADPEGARR